jgi:hypothetical protein
VGAVDAIGFSFVFVNSPVAMQFFVVYLGRMSGHVAAGRVLEQRNKARTKTQDKKAKNKTLPTK